MLKILEIDNLKNWVDENELVFVQYSAGWCGNCRIMKPKFRKHSEENNNASFLVVDAEKFPESRQLAKVDNLPTFAAFRGGQLVGQVQTNKADVLNQFIYETTNH